MTTRAFEKIAAGLRDALAFVEQKGDLAAYRAYEVGRENALQSSRERAEEVNFDRNLRKGNRIELMKS